MVWPNKNIDQVYLLTNNLPTVIITLWLYENEYKNYNLTMNVTC